MGKAIDSAKMCREIMRQPRNGYDKAAAQELSKAINAIFLLYRSGLGVDMDLSRAQELYKQAAKTGYSKAQYNLAIMTSKTAVTQRDYVNGAKWLQAAASKNHGVAQCQLAKMYESGEGVAWMWRKSPQTMNSTEARKTFQC